MRSGESPWIEQAYSELRSGWSVLLGCTLGVAAGAAALPFYTAGVFVKPLEASFGWTRNQLSWASMAWTLTIVVFAPGVGALIDRYGVRRPACLGLVSLAATFFALSHVQGQLWIYIAIQIVGAASGLSSTPVAFTRAINECFVRARGAALGFTLAGTGITATFAPPIITAIVIASGWRAGFRGLALCALCAVPFVWVLLGVGAKQRMAGASGSTPATTSSAGATPREIYRSATFQRLLAAFFVLALGVSGYVLHMIPMLTDAGIDLARAAWIQGVLGIAVIVGRLAIGLLVDHFFAPRLAALTLSLTALGMLLLATAGTALSVPAAFAIGFALGAEVDLIGYLTARYFGLTWYGRLYGALYGAFVLGTGLSPVLIAGLQAIHGSYALPLYGCASLVAAAVVLFATAPAFPDPPSTTAQRSQPA
jgi:MFS transporter, OFA family, oxalate/formate antiporter